MKTRKLTKQQAREALESLGPKVKLVGLVKHNGSWARHSPIFPDFRPRPSASDFLRIFSRRPQWN